MHPQHQLTQQSTPTPSTLNSWNAPREVIGQEPDGMGGFREVRRMLSAIDRLYARFASMYMHKWSSHFTSPDVIADWKKAWTSALINSGITFQMALEGIERCRTEFPTWPPTEGQFVALCKPELDYEDAFNYAVRELRKRRTGEDSWPVPAVYWAAMDFGRFELRQASYGQAAERWKRLLDKRLSGECPSVPVLDQPQLAAPARNAEGAFVTSAEAKASAMSAMRDLADRAPSRELAIKRARTILERHAAGEPVTPAQVAFAKEALARLRADDDAETNEQESP
jgi:hypothetical protein